MYLTECNSSGSKGLTTLMWSRNYRACPGPPIRASIALCLILVTKCFVLKRFAQRRHSVHRLLHHYIMTGQYGGFVVNCFIRSLACCY
jgi:hypothetical protein